MAATNWTLTSTHSGVVTTLRIETSDNVWASPNFPDNGATFDARGRLATYPVWGAAYDDKGGSFMTTRATVTVVRDRYTGRIVRYDAREDFGGSIVVSARTRGDIRGAFGPRLPPRSFAPSTSASPASGGWPTATLADHRTHRGRVARPHHLPRRLR